MIEWFDDFFFVNLDLIVYKQITKLHYHLMSPCSLVIIYLIIHCQYNYVILSYVIMEYCH